MRVVDAHRPAVAFALTLTPAMQGVLARMARAGRPPLDSLAPAAARAAYEKGAGVLEPPSDPLARVEDFTVAARDGHALPVRRYAPAAGPLPALVFFHGGGFTVGSIATHDALCRALAAASGAEVLSVDYRLAPEHRFPTAAEDAWDALQALQTLARWPRLAVGGDSAGGTLAAQCALRARDAGMPLALQLLVYPGTAATQDSASHRRFADGPVLTASLVAWFFGQYADAADWRDWRFAPLEAPDVDGVAPAWFGLAECDPLLDDGIAYADRLRAAGVPVALEIYRGVTHEFIKMGRAIPEALQARADAAAALRAAFQLQPPCN